MTLEASVLSSSRCETCRLNTYACTGHPGHIELPVPVYHVSFMDQVLRLLRARCVYCGHLTLHPTETNRFACKLRLLQHGLLEEAEELENVYYDTLQARKDKFARVNGHAEASQSDETESEDEDASLISRRIEFAKRAIRKAGGRRQRSSIAAEKIEAVSGQRRVLVKEFLSLIVKPKTCGTCKGPSHGFRKDRFSKIFRKPLSKEKKAKAIQGGYKIVNPLLKALNERKNEQKQRRDDREADEGIVADLDDFTSEGEGEDIEMLEVGGASIEPAMRSSIKSHTEESDIFMNASEVYAAIVDLFGKEKEIMELIYNSQGSKHSAPVSPDMFFIRNILVPPSRYRPEAKTGEGQIAEPPDNALYKAILNQCQAMAQIRKDMNPAEREDGRPVRDFRHLQDAWVRLQDAVNSMIDSNRNPVQGPAGRQIPDGIKQKLEKKEGLFRMNMMGKRVNFAARSVISPDPNIETNEIGVPPVFARKLTYPEPVTNHNFYELKAAVLNGFDKWPGAAAIENENGQVISLKTKNAEERQALANQLLAPSNTSVTGARGKKVHRHLRSGDIVIMNRQPTLHKPSMMCHRARILPGEKTIRMHYANCNTYNADFDGDEMNLHFPQNEIARAEASEIADTDHQYLVATSGKPLRGLIQDHISMGVWLTSRDTLFDREDYYQLLYSCLRPESDHTTTKRIETVPPAVIKPAPRWTGKQIISTILLNITPSSHLGLNLTSESTTKADRWGEKSEEQTVIFQNGELLCGILDKAQLGPSGGGFVHSIYEAYGNKAAGNLLGILGRLLTKFLHMRAFTCGMDDLELTEQGNETRRKILEQTEQIGLRVAKKYVTLDEQTDANDKELKSRLQEVLRDDSKQAGLDSVFNASTAILSSEITAACLPAGLRKPFPQNQMQTMTGSGAKGSPVNANLISCNLGQQVLEGRRVPVMVSGKTLPSFKPFDTNVRAGGYIAQRFLTGVKPQEYYFHAMAGREGLIDTAVKTARSGYLQRCLIKGMEGLRIDYDTSVRDSDGTMVQFLYGEDGLDVTKQKHLMDFKFLAENHLSLLAELHVAETFPKLIEGGATEWNKQALKRVRKTGAIDAMDPVLSHFNPASSIGSTSEKFAAALKIYCDNNPDKLLRDKKTNPNSDVSKKAFSSILNMKYMRSVIDAGEAVGIVAGQSVGEPSTQMTLNTFHLAGHSAKNVTLGIPRLREIVMTASKKISTPTMTLYLIPELAEEARVSFAKSIGRLTLAEVIDSVSVHENIGSGIGYEVAKTYEIQLNCFPSAEYVDLYAIGVADLLRTIEDDLIPKLVQRIKKELKRKGDGKLLKASDAKPEIGKSNRVIKDAPRKPEAELEGGEDDEDDDGDDDATNSKQKQNRGEAISYEEPDEEEQAIAREAQRQSTPDVDEPEDEGFVGSPHESPTETSGRDSVAGDNDDDDDDSDDGDDTRGKVTTDDAKDREDRIKGKNPVVTSFDFDYNTGATCKFSLEYDVATAKLLLCPLLESVCRNSIIRSVDDIGACTYTTEKHRDPATGKETDVPIVITEGVNLPAMHQYQGFINPHKLLTNSIHHMHMTYGIEAARALIILELDTVFKGHSISVDNRHLNLIADVMTQAGGFRPFSRLGLKEKTSPFGKMSFETTLGFLRDAVLDRDWDDLRGPSARIVMGKISRMGTGAFDVLTPLSRGNNEQEMNGL